jgi:hypothetical protein
MVHPEYRHAAFTREAIEMRRRRRHFKEGAGSVRVKLLDWEVLRVPHQLHHAL